MVLTVPLPFLDYHPLMQPVKPVSRPLILKLRSFRFLSVLLLVSSIIYHCSVQEKLLRASPAVWGLYASSSLIPIHFLVLLILAFPVNLIVGYDCLFRLQKDSFGISSKPPKIFVVQPAVDPVLQTAHILFYGSSNQQIDAQLEKYNRRVMDPDIKLRIQKLGERYKRINNHIPDPEADQEGQRLLMDEEKRLQEKKAEKERLRHRRFDDLTPWERLQLINCFIYVGVGVLYVSMAWDFYRQLGELACETLRNPERCQQTYGSTSSVVLIRDNHLFVSPRGMAQEPPPILPFAAPPTRLGSVDI